MTKFKIGSNQFKKVPIYHNGKVITRFTVGKQSLMQKIDGFMVKWIKRLAVAAFVLGVATGSLKTGQATVAPKIVSAEVIKNVATMPDIPVMDRIEKCESNDQQFNSQGQVLIHVNTGGTYDIGAFQINSAWNSTATKMGYDLTKEADNKAFAMWLYVNKGNQIWYSSQKCWDK